MLAHVCGHPVCHGCDTISYIQGLGCTALLANCRLLPSDMHLCISCMIPFSSKPRHCSLYTCLSCWFNLCCCPPKHSSANASLHYIPLVYTDVLPYTIHPHIQYMKLQQISVYGVPGLHIHSCLNRQTSEELQMSGMFK